MRTLPERDAPSVSGGHSALSPEHALHAHTLDEPLTADTTSPSVIAIAHVLRSWRRVALSAMGTGLVTAVVVLLLPSKYVSSVSVVPTGGTISAGGGSLAGIAQGLGIGALASALQGGGGSLNYFNGLLSSRTMAEKVLEHPLPKSIAPRRPNAANLLDIYDIDRAHPAHSLERSVLRFEKALDVQTDAAAGLLTVSVSAESPELARTLTNIVMEELDSLNSRVNRESAVAQLSSVESQLSMAQHAMYAAEDSLQEFLTANRTYTNSPQLVFQEGRIHRRVDIREATVQALSQQAEQARLDANRNMPAFSIVDAPNLPTERSSPKRRVSVIIAVLLGGLGAAIALFCVAFASAMLREDQRSPFRAIVDQLKSGRVRTGARRASSARW